MSGWLSALAGGMVGGGSAWQQSARDEELNNQRMALEEARNRAEMSRQTALESIRAANAKAAAQEQHGYRKAENVQEAGLTGERDIARQGLLDAAQDKQNVYTSKRDSEVAGRATDESKLDRASREAISAADNAARLKAAGISAGSENRGTLQVRDDGTVIRIVGDKATPVTDTTTGQPMKSSKGLNDATLKEVESYFIEARNPNLLPEQQAAALANGRELLRSGGQKTERQYPSPSSQDITNFQRFTNDPKAIESFRKKFGDTGLDQALKAGKPVDLTKPTESPSNGIISRVKPVSAQTLPTRDPYGRPTVEIDPQAQEQSDNYFRGVKEREQAQIKVEQDRMLEQSRGILNQDQTNASRAAEVRAITKEVAGSMTPEQAIATLQKFNTSLPEPIRLILEARSR